MSPAADPAGDPAPGSSSRSGRARGRLRAAVIVAGLGVASGSGIWLNAHAETPEPLLPRVQVDASEAPDDASSEEFCAAYGLPRGLDPAASVTSRVNLLRGQAGALARTGTPDDMPGAARDGFEVYAALSGVATPSQVEALGDGQGGSLDGTEVDGEALRRELGLDDEDAADLSRFVKYAAATCFTTAGGS